MSENADLANSIAETIRDYRAGEIDRPDDAHVLRWASQFPSRSRIGILREIDHVLDRTYMSMEAVEQFIRGVLLRGKMIEGKPSDFWRRVHFLDIQANGNSQSEMLGIVDSVIAQEWGFARNEDTDEANIFLYLDDGIFSGGHVYKDIGRWISNEAPDRARLFVITIATHESVYSTRRKIAALAGRSGKEIEIDWFAQLQFEDRLTYIATSDVLRPAELPDSEKVRSYVDGLRRDPPFRPPGRQGQLGVFSGEEGRSLLEQEFLVAGVEIREACENLNEYQRPLGNLYWDSLGFGSLFVTFRNCPNNAPLALWAGEPWYPLFPRKTNRTRRQLDAEELIRGIKF